MASSSNNNSSDYQRPPIQLVYHYEPLEENLLDQPGSIHVEIHRQQVEAYDAWHKQQKKKQRRRLKKIHNIQSQEEGAAADVVVETNNDQTTTEESSSGDTPQVVVPKPTPIGCATSGLWGLCYKEPETQREFNRFCHRSIETAAWMLLFVIWSASELNNDPEPAVRDAIFVEFLVSTTCIVFTLVIHCSKRGQEATTTVVMLRMIANFIFNMTTGTTFGDTAGRQCKPDPLYPALHGGNNPSLFDTYRGCLNTIPIGAFIVPMFGFHIVKTNIYTMFFLNFFAFIMYVLTFVGVFYQPVPEQDFLWEPTWDHIFMHVVVAATVGIASCLCGVGLTMSLQRGFEAAMATTYEIRASRRRIRSLDQLMRTLVPASALERLVAKKEVLDRRAHATVLFSDMVSFTSWSSTRNAKEVVAMLSVLVKRIDLLAASNSNVTKVKTIGDCYWAASGIPVANDNHAPIMIRFASEMMTIIREEAALNKDWDYLPVRQAFSQNDDDDVDENGAAAAERNARRPITFRTGIHTGPLAGGILGSQQITYEVFGQTSALANKVEAGGVAGRIAVSEPTRNFAESCGVAFRFEKYKPLLLYDTADQQVDYNGQRVNELQLFLVIENSLQADEAEHVDGFEVPLAAPAVVADAGGEEENAVKADRMRFLNDRIQNGDTASQSTGSLLNNSTGTNGLQNATEEASEAELLDRFSRSVKRCCTRVFEDPDQQDEYERFGIVHNVSFRVKTTAMVTAIFGIWTALTLFAAGSRQLPAAALFLMVIGLCTLSLSVILAEKRRVEVQRAIELEEITGGVIKAHDTTRPKPVDYYGLLISLFGGNIWLCSAFFIDNALPTNNIYFGQVVIGLIFIVSNHLPNPRSGFYAIIFLTPLQLLHTYVRRHEVQELTTFTLIGAACGPVLLYLYELPIKLRFIQEKVARSLVAQQKAISGIQEEVLKTMLPDFVISPLMLWLEADFAVNKAVVQDHANIAVAFIRLSSTAARRSGHGGGPSRQKELLRQSSPALLQECLSETYSNEGETEDEREEIRVGKETILHAAAKREEDDPLPLAHMVKNDASDDDNTTVNKIASASFMSSASVFVDSPVVPAEMAFLFDGHLVIDEILKKKEKNSASVVVDKVKTVGDLVIVAGSFRGHSPTEATRAMLSTACLIHASFEPDSCTTGLHIGPLMGVVLGYTRLAFDIFGDTVNTTSRIMTNPDNKHKVTASVEFVEHLGLSDNITTPRDNDNNQQQQQSAVPACTFGETKEIFAKGKGTITVQEVLYI